MKRLRDRLFHFAIVMGDWTWPFKTGAEKRRVLRGLGVDIENVKGSL